ncbi:hypothetical protein SAICODRAFT_21504 [Saitoella complicata NRRL Y-17804]|uniref:uncharacterized protein n=1 Tax=Saitoella complicata (strain BCRC 22490 / CBS 7301 / JCM 7358 / NBRC 10748 / NRRL Y-17804) TaxID=698492 RepID=UPI000867BF40|nr:uncharacterized protein SAICODRAFT_21504 [Saitoella complicata NRRL Y-17804]ODQ50530.1 hypothetical protein SAICODRAFT_21504 [Saitoella complicata NRRL Y-17804]
MMHMTSMAPSLPLTSPPSNETIRSPKSPAPSPSPAPTTATTSTSILNVTALGFPFSGTGTPPPPATKVSESDIVETPDDNVPRFSHNPFDSSFGEVNTDSKRASALEYIATNIDSPLHAIQKNGVSEKHQTHDDLEATLERLRSLERNLHTSSSSADRTASSCSDRADRIETLLRPLEQDLKRTATTGSGRRASFSEVRAQQPYLVRSRKRGNSSSGVLGQVMNGGGEVVRADSCTLPRMLAGENSYAQRTATEAQHEYTLPHGSPRRGAISSPSGTPAPTRFASTGELIIEGDTVFEVIESPTTVVMPLRFTPRSPRTPRTPRTPVTPTGPPKTPVTGSPKSAMSRKSSRSMPKTPRSVKVRFSNAELELEMPPPPPPPNIGPKSPRHLTPGVTLTYPEPARADVISPTSSSRKSLKSFSQRPSSSATRPAHIPTPLDLSAISKAEKHGSLTSMTDLISRSRKLEKKLEMGRTASMASSPKSGRSRWDSISGILNAFPPPTPAAGQPYAREGMVPIEYEKLESASTRNIRRRICGLPVWAFILMLFLIPALITLAVVLPIEIVGAKNSVTGPSAAQLAGCQLDLPCFNGGVSTVLSGGQCACLCTGAYSGDQCQVSASDPACTQLNLGSSTASVGSNIPSLLQLAPSFAINIDTSAVVSALENSNVSCTAQNALVDLTLPSSSSNAKRYLVGELIEVTSTYTSGKSAHPTTFATMTYVSATSITIRPSSTITAATATGLLVDTAMAAQPTAGASASSSNADSSTLNFAKCALLAIVQQKGIDVANTAHSALQTNFNQGAGMAGNVTVGRSIVIDLTDQLVRGL